MEITSSEVWHRLQIGDCGERKWGKEWYSTVAMNKEEARECSTALNFPFYRYFS
ncbi:hypothetical protein Hanom_Chr09g00838291 [Helianthus anomalus]